MILSQLVQDAIARLKQYNLGLYNSASNKFGLSGVGGMAANWSRHSKDIATTCEAVASIADTVVASTADAAGSATAAAGSAIAADASRSATQTLLTQGQATVQGLVTQAQTARDGAAADRALAQSYIGTATDVRFPAINYRLASAWDGTGQPAVYSLTGVVAVYRYDTRLDWDRGAWRRGRLARASTWYQETLNTATRGAKREFPVVALIVATASLVVIYDAHDLDSSGSPRMWMVFSNGNGALPIAAVANHAITSISARNGLIYLGMAASTGSPIIGMPFLDMLKDRSGRITASGTCIRTVGLANRGATVSLETSYPTPALVHNSVTWVDMRVLPGALLDPVSRLPVPTVAVATAGGASVLHPTGLVASITGTATGYSRVVLHPDGWMMLRDTIGATVRAGRLPYATVTETAWQVKRYFPSAYPALLNANTMAVCPIATGHDAGLVMLAEDRGNPDNGMVAYVTKDYATGWMPGDTRLATLCDGAGSNGTSGGNIFTAGSNGTMDSTAGFATINASLASTGGELVVTSTTTSGPSIADSTYSVTAGVPLTVEVTYRRGTTAGLVYMQVTDGTSGSPVLIGTGTNSTTNITDRVTVVPTGTQITIRLYHAPNAVGQTAFFDNVSVRRAGQFSDVITQQTVVNDALSSAGSWTLSAVTANTAAGTFDWSASGGYADLVMTGLQVGQQYVVVFALSSWTSGVLECRCPSNAPDTTAQAAAAGTFTKYFTATSASMTLRFIATSTLTASLTSVRVDMLAADRSCKGKGLIAVGTLSRMLLASVSDQCEYSGFGGNAYFDQPYNPDHDAGTGDLVIRLRGGSNVANGYFLDRDSPSATGARFSITANLNKAAFVISDGTNSLSLVSSTDFTGANNPRHVWTFIVRRATQTAEIWCDGALDVSTSCASIGSLTNTSARLRVGERVAASAPATGLSVSMLRIGTYAPPPAQIRKMDADEMAAAAGKMMLGGTTNIVQGLSLDEESGVLSVATADGVDQFAGLRRIAHVSAYSQTTGAEKVPNAGGPFAATTGWTYSNATSAVVNGEIRLTQVSTSNWGEGRVDIPVTAGKPLVVTCRLHVGTAASADIAIFDGATGLGVLQTTSTTLVEKSMLVTPSSSTLTLIMRNQSLVAGTTSAFALVSAKEVGAVSASSITSVSAGGGALLIGTAAEAGVVTDLQPLKDDLRQALPQPANDIVMEGVTVDATPLDLGKVFVMEGESVQIEMEVQATEYGQTPSEGASYTVRARVRRNLGGNAQLIGSAYHVTVDETTSTMDATVTVDTSAQAFSVNVTGKASTRLIWRARLRLNWISEVRHAA
ncbi:hypothetical protein ABMY26_23865 [Azospirillum sp. HJ39]|uniref:hypothetical protein n=1 Tax=Azospirillum sp. HJ39 TaxID=3159496 RepID=UPI003557E752